MVSVQKGKTVLHYAVDKQNFRLTQLLLEHKADANIKTKVAWGDVDAHVCVWTKWGRRDGGGLEG